jgi:hypothetical protein
MDTTGFRTLISADAFSSGLSTIKGLAFALVTGPIDTDNDGIFDEVDTQPSIFSDDFSDVSLGGTTTGTIITRGDQTLTITEELNPAGVKIAAAGGTTTAQVSACSGATQIKLNAGDVVVVTCTSVTIQVISGIVEVTFTDVNNDTAAATLDAGDELTFVPETFTLESTSGTAEITLTGNDGTIAEVTLPPNNSITFEPSTSSIITDPTNPDPVSVVIDGTETVIPSGGTIIVDTTPPVITVSLIPIEIEEDEGLFQVQFTITDNNDPGPIITADINGIPVTNGQIVELEIEEFMESEVEDDGGILEIEAPSFLLTVTATDNAGNFAIVTVIPSFEPPTTIDIIGDITGDQEVGPGQTLTINGVTVAGDIKVKGGTLIVTAGSTIIGDIKAKNCTEINIQSSSVNGKIKAKGCGVVTVTDNIFSDKVEVKENGDVTVTGNTIGKDLKIKENTSCTEGSNTVSGETKVEGCTA